MQRSHRGAYARSSVERMDAFHAVVMKAQVLRRDLRLAGFLNPCADWAAQSLL